MSWYSDAFVSDLSKVNTKNINTNGMKAFGDAFSKIGQSLKDDKLNEKKNLLVDSQLKTEQLNQESKQQNIDTVNNEFTQKSIDNAYLSNLDDKGKFDDKKGTIGVPENQVSLKAKKLASAWGKTQDDVAQKNFNSTAIKTATTYDSWDKFKQENPTLIENADGSTMQGIKTKFSDNTQQVKNLKTQQTINDLKNSVNISKLKLHKKTGENKPASASTIKNIDTFVAENFKKEELSDVQQNLLENKNEHIKMLAIPKNDLTDADKKTIKNYQNAEKVQRKNKNATAVRKAVTSRASELISTTKYDMQQAVSIATQEYNEFVNSRNPSKVEGTVDLSDKTTKKNITKKEIKKEPDIKKTPSYKDWQ
jgi:hypothetical protein